MIWRKLLGRSSMTPPRLKILSRCDSNATWSFPRHVSPDLAEGSRILETYKMSPSYGSWINFSYNPSNISAPPPWKVWKKSPDICECIGIVRNPIFNGRSRAERAGVNSPHFERDKKRSPTCQSVLCWRRNSDEWRWSSYTGTAYIKRVQSWRASSCSSS